MRIVIDSSIGIKSPNTAIMAMVINRQRFEITITMIIIVDIKCRHGSCLVTVERPYWTALVV